VVTKLRVYANQQCAACDPVKYRIVGTNELLVDPNEIHQRGLVDIIISEGVLPWIDEAPGRNSEAGVQIISSFESGDTSLNFTEIEFTNDAVYQNYIVLFDANRVAGSPLIVGEVELVGVVYEPTGEFLMCAKSVSRLDNAMLIVFFRKSASPTRAPTNKPTAKPTTAPSTMKPTSELMSLVHKFCIGANVQLNNSFPSGVVTNVPTKKPTTSSVPTKKPTSSPTKSPVAAPTTNSPTTSPTTRMPATLGPTYANSCIPAAACSGAVGVIGENSCKAAEACVNKT
jgi:hypothetical protein